MVPHCCVFWLANGCIAWHTLVEIIFFSILTYFSSKTEHIKISAEFLELCHLACILTNFRVRPSPENCSKYTTYNVVTIIAVIINHYLIHQIILIRDFYLPYKWYKWEHIKNDKKRYERPHYHLSYLTSFSHGKDREKDLESQIV